MNGPSTSTDYGLEQGATRRTFLKKALFGMGALLLGGGGICGYRLRSRAKHYPGAVLGASSKVGHLLRDQTYSSPHEEIARETVIVGGGISGLSAAWWFGKNDYKDFTLLELEPNVGGNSQSGKNEISAFPWAAHYLPLPGPDDHLVRTLLEELNVIQGYDGKGLPVYDEFYLCADPHERLLIQGKWQEGLVPQTGLTQADRIEYDAFFKLMETYKATRGRDRKRAFAIPVDYSSTDPEFLALDKVSMADFMKSKGWVSEKLHWYVNYCCRDDYGLGHEKVSAWAGIHYFASRAGLAANADSQTVLTWPEGNGWLVSRLREKFPERIQSNSLVYSIRDDKHGAIVDYLDVTSKKHIRINARQVIFAAPRFVASHVIEGFRNDRPSYLRDLRYAPWMVANVSLRSLPSGNGAPLSWDNVSFYSQSLGYIVATHQKLSSFPKETVLTYYLPLDGKDPTTARKEAAQRSHQEWAQDIADDLERMHRGIKNEIKNIDVWVWGHGMISPNIGYLWGESRKKMLESKGRIHFAHSDMSGISIFEEAQYHGVQAAKRVLSSLGRKKGKTA